MVVKNVKVTGSASHDDFVAFQNNFNPIFEQLSKSQQPQSSVTFTNDDYEALEKKLDSFILANKDSYVSPFVIVVTSQLSDDMTRVEKRYGALKYAQAALPMAPNPVNKTNVETMIKKLQDGKDANL